MTGIESLRLGFAFGLGTATFFAPCALPLLPGYVAFFLGDDEAVDEAMSWRLARAVGISLTTSLGFLVVYGLLAAVVFLIGTRALGSISLLELLVGAILIVIGAFMATGRKLSLPVTIQLPERRRGVVGYFAFGVVYAAAAAGCTAGLFIALVGIALPAGAVGGLALVGAYAAGMAVLLTVVTILSALGRGVLIRRLAASGERIRRIAGVVLILAGIVQLYYFVYVFDGLAMFG